MIKAGSGFSQKINPIDAANEATSNAMNSAGINKADIVLVFCTFPHRSQYKEILNIVSQISKTQNIFGCSAIGVLSNFGEEEAEPGVVVLIIATDEFQGYTFLSDNIEASGSRAGEDIASKIKSKNANSKKGLLAILPDPFFINPEFLIKGIKNKLDNIQMVGASASEEFSFNETFVFYKDNVFSKATSGIYVYGDLKYDIGITQGCMPLGSMCKITKANQNIIYELDGKPALEVLKENIPSYLLEDPAKIPYTLFLGFPPNPEQDKFCEHEYLVRNIIGIDPNTGAIGASQLVKEGETIYFTIRNPDMAREDLKRMLQSLKQRNSEQNDIKFGIYFNCCGRGSSLYGHKGIDTAYITNELGDFPFVGFFGNSEIAPLNNTNHLFTYTGVLTLFYESSKQ